MHSVHDIPMHDHQARIVSYPSLKIKKPRQYMPRLVFYFVVFILKVIRQSYVGIAL